MAIFYPGTAEGCAAMLSLVGNGIVPTALELLDGETLACGGASFPGGTPDGAGFLLMAEADGSLAEAERVRAEIVDAAGAGAGAGCVGGGVGLGCEATDALAPGAAITPVSEPNWLAA